MYGNLTWLMYFCNKTHPISVQRIFVNCLFVVYFIDTKNFYKEFGHILAKKLCLPKTILKSMTQNKFDLNWQYVVMS